MSLGPTRVGQVGYDKDNMLSSPPLTKFVDNTKDASVHTKIMRRNESNIKCKLCVGRWQFTFASKFDTN